MIQRLFNLYNKAPDSQTTPTERFVSEGLASLLESNPNFRRDFLNKLCGLELEEAIIETEASYPEKNSFIDIQIKGSQTLVFIEVKVDSPEGGGQLTKYSELLELLSERCNYSNTQLIYLTRDFVDEPDTQGIIHIRWSQVSELLKNFRNQNQLIDAYLNFLENLRMGPMKELTEKDIKIFQNYVSLHEKIYGMLDVMKSEFQKRYGSVSYSENKKQIIDNKRIILFKEPVLTGKGWTELGLGIYFEEIPYLRAHLFVSNNNDNFDAFNKYADKMTERNNSAKISQYQEGTSIGFTENLHVLVHEPSPRDRLISVVNELFNKIDTLISETSNLEWVINTN